MELDEKTWVEKFNSGWLDLLVAFQGWRQCPLLTADSFAALARDCGVRVWPDDLEALERQRLFFASLRTSSPVFVEKVERVGDGLRLLGELQPNEVWSGETRDTFGEMPWTIEQIPEWRKDGFAWDPAVEDFRPWSKEFAAFGGPQDRAFYSRFQLAELACLIDGMTLTVRQDGWAEISDAEASRRGRGMAERATDTVGHFRSTSRERLAIPRLCQLLAPRYFPDAQGDGHRISVIEERDCNYWRYCENWDPRRVLEAVGASEADVREIHDLLCHRALSDDELLPWYELVTSMPQAMRTKLRGRQRVGFVAHEMEFMVRHLLGDLTGTHLTPPALSRGFRGQPLEPLDRKAVAANRRFVSSRFGSNPNPRLLLVVEGDGELEHLPRLFPYIAGASTEALGITLFPLKGVSAATAGQCTALRLLIDDRHAHDTVVFVLLDDENGAGSIPSTLASTPSMNCPWRTVSREDYFHVWDSSIEWTNFTDEELARALSAMARREGAFADHHVAAARAQITRASDAGGMLDALFRSRIGHGLKRKKRRLLGSLCDQLIIKADDPTLHEDLLRRPLVQVLRRVASLASRNVAPFDERMWQQNQASGHFGVQRCDPPWATKG